MIRIFNHYVPMVGFVTLALDLLVLLTSANLTRSLWRAGTNQVLVTCAFALVMVMAMAALGMYQHQTRESLPATLRRLVPSFVLGFAQLLVLAVFIPSINIGAGGLAALLGIGALGVLAVRLLVLRSAQSALLETRVMFVGAGQQAFECLTLASSKQGFHQFCVVGCVALDGEQWQVPQALRLPLKGSLLTMARNHGVREIVVTVSNRRGSAFPVEQLLACAVGGVSVIDAATFFERESCQIRVNSLQPSYLIFGGGFDQGWLRASSKRVIDLAASALIAVVTLPLMLLTALAIVIEDGAPVLYRQERVGKHGAMFHVLKFRSMGRNAEAAGGPTWAAANDTRVTRVGRLIRALRIDELPQIFNVLKGEMSFVGPRPERAYFVDQLSAEIPYYDVRHTIQPGITGLAQVRYQYGASVEDAVQKLQYDLYYVKNNSLFLDLLILIATVQVVLFGKGSR